MSRTLKKYLISKEEHNEYEESGYDDHDLYEEPQVEELELHTEKFENAVDATVALETYVELLSSGHASKESLAFMQVGTALAMNQLNGNGLGLESFEFDQRNDKFSLTISEESFKDKLKAAGNYIAELFEKLMNYIASRSREFFSGFMFTKKRFEKLKEDIQKSKTPKILDFSDNPLVFKPNPHMFINGKLIKDHANASSLVISMVADYIPTYIKESLNTFDEIANKINKDTLTKESLEEAERQLITHLLDHTSNIDEDEVLPGDMQFYDRHSNGTHTLGYNRNTAENPETIGLDSVNLDKDMGTLGNMIDKLSGLHETSQEIDKKIKKIRDMLKPALKKTEGNEQQRRFASRLVGLVKEMSMSTFMNMAHCAGLLKSVLVVCEAAYKHSLKTEKE